MAEEKEEELLQIPLKVSFGVLLAARSLTTGSVKTIIKQIRFLFPSKN